MVFHSLPQAFHTLVDTFPDFWRASMELWTVVAVWFVASVCLAPLMGRFLRGGSPRPADGREAEPVATLSTGRWSGLRRYWQSAG